MIFKSKIWSVFFGTAFWSGNSHPRVVCVAMKAQLMSIRTPYATAPPAVVAPAFILQRRLYSSFRFRDAANSTALSSEISSAISINKEEMRARSGEGGTTVGCIVDCAVAIYSNMPQTRSPSARADYC